MNENEMNDKCEHTATCSMEDPSNAELKENIKLYMKYNLCQISYQNLRQRKARMCCYVSQVMVPPGERGGAAREKDMFSGML